VGRQYTIGIHQHHLEGGFVGSGAAKGCEWFGTTNSWYNPRRARVRKRITWMGWLSPDILSVVVTVDRRYPGGVVGPSIMNGLNSQ